MEHWAKNFSKKLPQNIVQSTFGHFWERFWEFLDFWKFFDFFENFRRLDRPWNTGQKFFSKKLPQNRFKNTLGHFWERFWAFLEFWKTFDFFESFRRLDPPWNTGQKFFFSKKLPENMFKTRLDTFGNDFGHFWIFEKFLIFLKIFEDSTVHGTLGKKFFRKNYLKTCSKHVWTLLGTILGILGILKIFWFFWKFSKTRPSMEHWAKVFFSKKTPENMFKTRLDTFGNDFGHFRNFENFLIFLKIFEDSPPSMEHWAKKFFEKNTPKHVQNTFGHFWERFWALLDFWKVFDFFENFRRLDPPWNTGQKFFFGKKHPKTCSKHVWTLLGTILGIFGFLKIFWFFWKFSKTRPSMEHWAKKFAKKLPQNMFKARLDTFGNDFGNFWIFENFLIFLKIFEDSTLHGTLGKSFVFEKYTRKHAQNTFGHFWERFWAFLDFWNFFDFFENFRRLDPPWNTGQKNFWKNYPKTCSKHVWTLLGTILGIFGFLKIFWFFWKFSKTRPSMEHWAKKKFSKKLPQNMFKTRLDTFGNDFGHFWIFEKLLIFLKIFEDSTLHGTLGKKNFRKNYPKTCSKHVWTLLGTILGILGFLKIFWFFWKFSKTRPSMEHWAKNFSKKLPQNLFKARLDTFGNDFGNFWIFENFLIFLKIFEDSTLHGTLGKKLFRKNHLKTCSKHVWTLLGTILGILGILKIFWFFWKFSKTRPSMEHWAKNFFEKITPKHVQNTFGHFWERFWAFLEFWKFFDFFENFRRLDPPWNTGQKIFRKNYPKTCSKHVWTLLGTILGIFGFLKNFWFFWKFSKTRPSMEHWAKIFFEKITWKHVQNTFGHFWERFWAF